MCDTHSNPGDPAFRAQRELCAFLEAVSDLYGLSQVRQAAEDWITVFEAREEADAFDWRSITIAAAEHLARRLTADTKVSTIPSSSCSKARHRA